MQLAYEKLQGLDRDRVLSVVEPVLRAHGVDAVELIWRSDQKGWILYLTIERPGTSEPGDGVTLDLCADVSRDLSAALDVADVMPGRYRLEVGSPGLERALYGVADYQRFAGHTAKIKLREPVDGQAVLRGSLKGIDSEGRVVLEADGREWQVDAEQIQKGQLVFDWHRDGESPGAKPGRRRGRAHRT